MENPAIAAWGLAISYVDFEKLKRGFRARDMDDRWIFKDMTDEELAVEAATNGATTDDATMDDATMDEATTDEELTDEDLMDELRRDEATTDEATLDLDQRGNISIRRSWTNRELYRLIVSPGEGRANPEIEAIAWEQNQGDHISEEQAKTDAVILCRQILGCVLFGAPEYDNLDFSAFHQSAGDSTTVQNGTN